MPESLRERIQVAVRKRKHAPRSRLHEELRQAADRLLVEATTAPPTRDTALTLLAADALMTFACEAIAEEAPERLGELK